MKAIDRYRGRGASFHTYKHGLSYMREYYIFNTMRAKCYNPKDHAYKYYGARGISICEEWLNNPKLFIDYVKALPDYGTPTYSIDRINNDGNYEPGNIRWASKSIQVTNSRTVKNINHRNIPQSGFIGIVWDSDRNKWRISISVKGRKNHLGYYDDLEEALIIRNKFISENKLTYFELSKIAGIS